MLAIINIIGNSPSTGTTSTPGLVATFTPDSTTINGAGGVAGLAQKLDNTFISFAGGVLRKTDRGFIAEPASQNFVAASSALNNAAWAVDSGGFAGTVAKTSLLTGETAYEFESNTSGGRINQGSRGTFTAGPEFFWMLVEAMPSATDIDFFVADQTAGNTSVSRVIFNFPTQGWTDLGGSGTSRKHGFIDFGTGPNGGRAYMLFIIYTAATAGNTRRFFIYPNGSSASTAGRKVTFHHVQQEVGSWATSPIINPSTTSNTRAAETITATVTNGTYDVRYSLQDGTIIDRYASVAAGGVLPIPTDITQNHLIWIPDAFTINTQRNGYMTSVLVWNQKSNNVHALGDSYLVVGAQGGQNVIGYLPPKLYRPRVWTFDGVGATSLTQQATRFDGTPAFYGDTLIVVDGVIDGLTADTDFATLVDPALTSMYNHLTTSPKQWLYIQPNPDINAGSIGSVYYTRWLLIQSQIKAAYPANYVDTLSIMQSHGNGSAGDNADINAGHWPRSLRIDPTNVHPNDLGSLYFANIIVNALQNKMVYSGW